MAGRKPKPTALKKLEGNPGKKKTEYEGAGACKGNARLSEVAASGGEGRVEDALSETVRDGGADGDRHGSSGRQRLLCRFGFIQHRRYYGIGIDVSAA